MQGFERTATGDRNCRDDKSDAYDRECLDTDLNRRLIVGEKSDHLSRYEQGKQHTDRHHTGGQTECSPEDLPDTSLLAGTVVEADDRADSLDDSVCRQVNKCLQLIISPKHENIFLRKCCQDTVQTGDHERRQRHVQGSRNADGVQIPKQCLVKRQVLTLEGQRQRTEDAE